MRFPVLVGFFLVAGPSQGQGPLTLSDFLNSAKSEISVRGYENQIHYLETKPYKLPWLNKTEFRNRNNELLYNREQYALRFDPANPWQIRYNNQYFKSAERISFIERQLALKQALSDRYYLAMVYLEALETKILLEEEMQWIESSVVILQQQQQSTFFDAEDYLELRIDKIGKMVDVEEASYEEHQVLEKIQIAAGKPGPIQLPWDVHALISIESIQLISDSLGHSKLVSTEAELQKEKVNMAEHEFNLEKNNIDLGFLQTMMSPYKSDLNRNPFGISFGVTIPITNPNKGDMAREKLNWLKEQNELDEVVSLHRAEVTLAINGLKSQLVRYSALRMKIEEINGQGIVKTLLSMSQNNPIPAIKLQMNLAKLKSLQVKIKYEIYSSYIEVLERMDLLQQEPLINYLSADLEALEK